MVARAALVALLLLALAGAGYCAATTRPRCRWRPAHADTLTAHVNGQWACDPAVAGYPSTDDRPAATHR